MTCDHIDYDDYFEICLDCGMPGEHIHAVECKGYPVNEEGCCEHCGILIEEETAPSRLL